MGLDSKKKIGVAGLASLLLVAMVIGVTISVNKNNNDASASPSNGNIGSVTASNKAVTAICAPTDYKETCEQSLSSANTTNPKELIRLAFSATEKNIGDVLKNSALLQEAAKDERTKGAFNVCSEVLETSIEDVQRSFDKLGEFNVDKIDEYVSDLRTWLSGAITYQETCIDAFENTTGDTGEKMKKLLKTAGELTSNGLAMVTDLSGIFSALNLKFGSSRRLLTEEEGAQGRMLFHPYPYDYVPGGDPNAAANSKQKTENSQSTDHTIPSFVDTKARRLMSVAPLSLTPNAVVAQDGSGQFKTIGDAINTIPPKNNKTFVIYVKAGVYKEYVEIPKKVNNVVLIGDGPLKTIITGNKSYAGGVATFYTATLVVNGEDFFAKDIGIENTAGAEGHQAVAVRVSGDKAVFYNVHMNGYQDTLYAHNYRQLYRDCTISGTIDYIFGDSLAYFQNCTLVVRKPMENQACMVTAQGRKERRSIGAIVIQNCSIEAEQAFLDAKPALKAYLGRPWKEFSRTLIMQSNIDGFIAPEGWSPWMGTFALDTLYYGEYENHGAGSNITGRVQWKGIQNITAQIAQSFTPGVQYQGDDWIVTTGVPYNPGMF